MHSHPLRCFVCCVFSLSDGASVWHTCVWYTQQGLITWHTCMTSPPCNQIHMSPSFLLSECISGIFLPVFSALPSLCLCVVLPVFFFLSFLRLFPPPCFFFLHFFSFSLVSDLDPGLSVSSAVKTEHDFDCLARTSHVDVRWTFTAKMALYDHFMAEDLFVLKTLWNPNKWNSVLAVGLIHLLNLPCFLLRCRNDFITFFFFLFFLLYLICVALSLSLFVGGTQWRHCGVWCEYKEFVCFVFRFVFFRWCVTSLSSGKNKKNDASNNGNVNQVSCFLLLCHLAC